LGAGSNRISGVVSLRFGAGIFITYNYVATGVLAALFSLGFLALYRYTSIGLALRCAADNSRAALAIGIHVSNQVSLAWAMSAALAGLGGTLLATLDGLSLGLADIGLVAFPVIVLGGLSSLGGAFIAGLMLGMLQSFTDGDEMEALKNLDDGGITPPLNYADHQGTTQARLAEIKNGIYVPLGEWIQARLQ
jgi:branched-subunit amino acid ABC-type transport system permease component